MKAVGQSPLGLAAKPLGRGPAQENALSWLWDAVEDFSKRFFPFLSKPAVLMESLVQAGVPRAPVEPFCAVLPTPRVKSEPLAKSEPHTPARC